MESCIKQNNAIEIYQDYFNEIDEATDCEEPKAKVSLSWRLNGDSHCVVRPSTSTETRTQWTVTSDQSAASPGTRTESSRRSWSTAMSLTICLVSPSPTVT